MRPKASWGCVICRTRNTTAQHGLISIPWDPFVAERESYEGFIAVNITTNNKQKSDLLVLRVLAPFDSARNRLSSIAYQTEH